MHVVLHVGAHQCDGAFLRRLLARNEALLHGLGIAAPRAEIFRPALHALPEAGGRGPALSEFLEAIGVPEGSHRLVLSNDHFMGPAARAMTAAGMYPAAGERISRLVSSFRGAELTIAMALRNPLALAEELQRLPAARAALSANGLACLLATSWAELIARLREAVPEVQLLVWTVEDAPLSWPEIVDAVLGPTVVPFDLEGLNAYPGSLMGPFGESRLNAWFAANPPESVDEWRRGVLGHLDRLADDGALEEELTLPGVTPEIAEAVSEAFEAELGEIAGMAGVTLLGAGSAPASLVAGD